MGCNFDRNLLHESLDHELDSLNEIILHKHLAICPECRKELNRLKVLDWDLRFADHIEIPHGKLKEAREQAINRCFAAEKIEVQNTWKDVYRIQTKAAANAVNYLKYVPGTSLLKRTGQASVRFLGNKLSPGKLLFERKRG